MDSDSLPNFRDMLLDYSMAVLVTRGIDGSNPFHSRPMAIAGVDANCDVWFITSEESAKVHEIESDTHVHVICQDGHASCLTLSGRASLNRDRDRVRELWKPAFKSWFPEGENDPSIVLIHVIGEHGEFWDGQGLNGIKYALQTLKALLTGTTPAVEEGNQHGQVDLGGVLNTRNDT